MPEYLFHLHDGPARPPMDETVEAQDDAEAKDLAQIRLSLSRAFTDVRVRRNGVELFHLRRDSKS
jgi:hypothetical protein